MSLLLRFMHFGALFDQNEPRAVTGDHFLFFFGLFSPKSDLRLRKVVFFGLTGYA